MPDRRVVGRPRRRVEEGREGEMIRRFDLDTGLVRTIHADGLNESPLLSYWTTCLEDHLKHRADVFNRLMRPPRTPSEREQQESLRSELRYHCTGLEMRDARHDWHFQAFYSSGLGGVLHIELRASKYVESGGADYGPPLVAAVLEIDANDTLVVRVSRAQLASVNDASAAVLEADIIIDVLAAAWLRIGTPPQSEAQL